MSSEALIEINNYMEKGEFDKAIYTANQYSTLDLNLSLCRDLILADIYTFQGKFDKTARILEDTKANIEDNDYTGLYLYHQTILAGLNIRNGDVKEAYQKYNRNEKLFFISMSMDYSNNYLYGRWIGRYHHTKGNIYLNLGQLSSALAAYTASIAIKKETKEKIGLSSSFSKLSLVYKLIGDYKQSLEYANRSIAIHQAMDNRQAEAVCMFNAGLIYREMDQIDEAIGYLKKSLIMLEYSENPYLLSKANYELFLTILPNDRDLALKFHNKITEIHATVPNNRRIGYLAKISEALKLKTSNRGRDKYKSQEILKEIIDSHFIDYRLIIHGIFHLLELLLDELKAYNENEVLLEVIEYIHRVKILAEENNSNAIYVQILLVEAKLEMIKENIDKTDELYKEAITVSKIKGLSKLRILAEKEQLQFETDIQSWHELSTKGTTIVERVKESQIKSYIQSVVDLYKLGDMEVSE